MKRRSALAHTRWTATVSERKTSHPANKTLEIYACKYAASLSPLPLSSPPLPLPHTNEGKRSDLEASSTGYNKRHSFPFISRCQGKQETICTTLHAHFNFYGAFVLVHVDWKITLALTSPPHTHTDRYCSPPTHSYSSLST